MGLGKIVGLGDFTITYSSSPNYAYDNYYFISPHIPITSPIGRTVTISKDTMPTDFWNRVMTMGQIKFVLYGGKGGNGVTTSHGNGGAGSNGSFVEEIYYISSSDTVFTLELSGWIKGSDKGGGGGTGPKPTAPTTTDPENPGESGIGGGGGGGCSGESMAKNVYSQDTGNVLNTFIGGDGGRGGNGCSVYVKEPGSPYTNRLATALGGGGGGGAAGFASSLDGEGGLAGSPATMVNGVPTPGAGGSGQRKEDNNANGQNATSPATYTSTYSQPRIEVFAPLW